MIKKIVYTYSPAMAEITNEIDKELLSKMIIVAGGDPITFLEEMNSKDLDHNDSAINKIAVLTPYRILSVDVISILWDVNYSITFDDSIRSTYEENRVAVELEFVANNI